MADLARADSCAPTQPEEVRSSCSRTWWLTCFTCRPHLHPGLRFVAHGAFSAVARCHAQTRTDARDGPTAAPRIGSTGSNEEAFAHAALGLSHAHTVPAAVPAGASPCAACACTPYDVDESRYAFAGPVGRAASSRRWPEDAPARMQHQDKQVTAGHGIEPSNIRTLVRHGTRQNANRNPLRSPVPPLGRSCPRSAAECACAV